MLFLFKELGPFLLFLGPVVASTSLTIGWLVCDEMTRDFLVPCRWEIDGWEIDPFGLFPANKNLFLEMWGEPNISPLYSN